MKIIHFTNPEVPFINTTLDWAIQNLPYTHCECDCYCHFNKSIMHFVPCCYPKFHIESYTYDDLKQKKIKYDDSEIVLFLEAGQIQHKHGGLTLEEFKQKYPNSHVVVWSSDGIYYKVNNLEDQFNCKLADLVFDVQPEMVEYWRRKGCNSECIPWTISKKLHTQLRNLAGPTVDFSRKTNDFIMLMNLSGEYRQNMLEYLCKSHIVVQGGYGRVDGNDLNQVFGNFLNTWINVETSSHNREELTRLGCMKGFRAAVGIALNCLTVNDDHSNVRQVWNMPSYPSYRYGNWSDLSFILWHYKRDLDEYTYIVKRQQEWLQNNLLDNLILNSMLKYNI